MERVTYDHTQADELKERFPYVSPHIIDRLCDYLGENALAVEAQKCSDAQSGWTGDHLFIGKINLSLNGYCLSDDNIDLFLAGGHDPKWYMVTDKESKEPKRDTRVS